MAATIDHPGFGASRRPGSRGGLGGIQEDPHLGGSSAEGVAEPRPVVGRRRPSANAQNRLTITNYSEKDVEDGINPQVLPPTRGSQRAWPTAENEKKMLYETAVARVQKVQGTAAMANATAASDVRLMILSLGPESDGYDQIPSNATSSTTAPSKKRTHWPTAEAEKVRLYEHAQLIAKRTQAYGVSSPSLHSRSSSEAKSPGPSEKQFPPNVVPGPAISAGAALYQQAVSSISPNVDNPPATSNSRVAPPSPPSSTNRVPHYPSAEEEKAAVKHFHEAKQAVDQNQSLQYVPTPHWSESTKRVPHYPSAEEEKAALRRYHEAKQAVDRNQTLQYAPAGSSAGGAPPVSYDSLYPEPNGSGQASGSDMPPPFEASGSSSRPHYLNEKERLRRQYEAQDTAALAAQAQAQEREHASDFSHTAKAPSYSGPPPEDSGLSEKEVLRRRLEEQDRVAQFLQQQQLEQEQPRPPLPRANSSRAPPVPPMQNGFRPLTAAEEKAQLRAKYEAEEQTASSINGHAADAPPSRHPYATATPTSGTPPPLMPRPPVEYIQETQEADIRGRYYDSLGVGLASALDTLTPAPARMASPVSDPRLDVRPFSPFDVGLGYDLRAMVASPSPIPGYVPPPPPPSAPY